MHVRRYATPHELAELAPEWNALARGCPLHTWEWLATWWKHYAGPRSELYVLGVYTTSGALAGIAPWYVEHTRSAGRAVRFLGSGEVCTDHLTLLCRPGAEREVAAAIAEWLCADCATLGDWLSGQRHDGWDVLQLAGVDADDVAIGALAEELAGRGASIHRKMNTRCWIVELPATWDEYVATLSKSHRKQLRQIQRRMIDTGRAVCRRVAHDGDLQRGLHILIDLHQRRRKSLGDPGVFASRRFAAFHAEATALLLRAGHLRLNWLELDGQPVAAEYQLSGAGVIYCYQSGIEPAALESEPGTLATSFTMQLAFSEGWRAVDFMRGDEEYKAHWRAQPHPNGEVRIWPNRASGRVRHGVWRAGQEVKSWLKSGRSAAERWAPSARRPARASANVSNDSPA